MEPMRTTAIDTTTTTLIPTFTTVTTTTTSTTTVTTTTTTTTIMISTNPTTTFVPMRQAQIHNERITTAKPLNNTYRSRNHSTQHWLKTSHSTTEQILINYTDRSTLDICDGFYDAITMYKGILFIFKGQVNKNFSYGD